MLRILAWLGIILFCLIASVILPFYVPRQVITGDSDSMDSSHIIGLADTTPHSSINISGNQDFILQGWPGNGTEQNPFEIEGLSISATECCINMSDTDAFFVVKDCALSAEDFYEGRPFAMGIFFPGSFGSFKNNDLWHGDDYLTMQFPHEGWWDFLQAYWGV